jgi:hypothetical protein
MNKNNDWLSKIRPGGTEFGILILPQQAFTWRRAADCES